MLFQQERLPAKGETFTADEATFTGGGKGANQAVQIAKLESPVHLIGAVGKDPIGNEMLQRLSSYGVNIDTVREVEERTGIGIVNFLQNGDLSSTIFRGANYCVSSHYVDDALPLLEKSWGVLLQLEIPVEVVAHSIKTARESDCFIILNAAPMQKLPRDLLYQLDCLVINEVEASFYLNNNQPVNRDNVVDAAEPFCRRMKRYLVVTLGAEGSIVFTKNAHYRIKAEKVAVQETTGAGDSFIGTLAVMLKNGADIKTACEAAAAASSITIQQVGAQEAMPTKNDITHHFPLFSKYL
jgi:ribokinase